MTTLWKGEHRTVIVEVLGPHNYVEFPLPPAPARDGECWPLGDATSRAEAIASAVKEAERRGVGRLKILRCRSDESRWYVVAQWTTPAPAESP